MKRLLPLLAFLTLLPAVALTQPLIAPFDFLLPTYDTTRSAWLPQLPLDDVDAMGFLRTSEEGHFEYAGGRRERLVGVSVIASACFPDSSGAITTAGRLRKLGVNMVRFNYFDFHNSNGSSTLAPGNKGDTLSESQMKRLDWFLYQLKLNGIRAHFVLKSRGGPRRDDGVPGWDSAYSSGQYITYFSPQFQALQRRYLSKLLGHMNPYTGKRYADDPVIALLTITDQNSLHESWVADRLNTRANNISYHHSRLLDTLYTEFLRRRYSSTQALRDAYREGIAAVGANVLKNPGFESFTDNWTLNVGEGAQASGVIVQGADVAPGEGQYSYRIAVRASNGNENRITLDQVAIPIGRNRIYRLRFRAKTDSAAGRTFRIALLSNGANLGVNQTVTLTTVWQTFEFTFRATAGDTVGTMLRIYGGRMMGDIFLDGFALQETGREGLGVNERLEDYTVGRARYSEAATISLKRMYDQVDFYDSLARTYYRTMSAHLKSLGVKAPIAGTNATRNHADTWMQSEYDFTAETAGWDFNGQRNPTVPYTDSTWVIRNYSVLGFRDQKIPEFSRNAISGKPFIAEQYSHTFPNSHRSEMMLFMPSYASLHDWDGLYFYLYNDRSTELADRRRFIKDDFQSIMADASVCALMPQVSEAMRGGWISPAERTIKLFHDTADLRAHPLFSRGTYGIDGTFLNVVNLVNAVRIDSFAASKHYTAGDYFVTIPSDDNIESDTRQIMLDMTKGIMQLNTPRIQGGSGVLARSSSIRTDQLIVNWIGGAAHTTYLWSSLDTFSLDSARRSLLTVSTRSLNGGAVWQYGDSSIGKNWGAGPIQMESVKLGVQFATGADSVHLYPLDSLGNPTGRTINATKTTSQTWRIQLDLEVEKTPWFGVEQFFAATEDTSTTDAPRSLDTRVAVGQAYPNPGIGEVTIELDLPEGGMEISAEIRDILGRSVQTILPHLAPSGRSALPLELYRLPTGTYFCIITVGEETFSRRVVLGW